MKPRVTSVSRSQGPIERQASLEARESALVQAEDKWAPRSAEFKGKRWAECPPEFVADFVRAVAADMEAEYGSDAVSKAGQMLGCKVAEKGVSHWPLQGSWPEAAIYCALEVSFVPANESDTPEVSFELSGADGMSEREVREALREWAKTPSEPRFTFDPLKDLPLEQLMAVVEQVEALMGGDDLGVLIGSAGFLMTWKSLEGHRAAEMSLNLQGLHDDGEELRPGEDCRISARAKLLDAKPSETLVSEEATYQVSVPKRRPR